MGLALLFVILIILTYVNSNNYRIKLRHASADSYVESFVPKEYPEVKKGWPPTAMPSLPPGGIRSDIAVKFPVMASSNVVIKTNPNVTIPSVATSVHQPPKVTVPIANHQSMRLHNQSVIYRSTYPVSWNPSVSPRKSLIYCHKNAIHMVDPMTGNDEVITGQGTKPTGSKEHIPMEEAKLDGPFCPVW